jgi:hypothetical protein
MVGFNPTTCARKTFLSVSVVNLFLGALASWRLGGSFFPGSQMSEQRGAQQDELTADLGDFVPIA